MHLTEIYVPETVRTDVRDKLLKTITEECGGYTTFDTLGCYLHEDGRETTEETEVVRAVGLPPGRAQELAQWLREVSGDEAVLWHSLKVTGGFEKESPEVIG